MDRIQPKQIQLHTISSPSGHLSITQDDTTVKLNFSSAITGNFNFKGNLTRSGERLHSSSTTNTVLGTRSYSLAGTNNTVTGTDCMAVNSRYNTISGTNNVDLNGDNNFFHSGTLGNTILAGKYVNVSNDIQGSTCIKDGNGATTLSSRGDNTLNIKFDGGTFFDGSVYFNNTTYFNSSSTLNLSGDLNVLGTPYWNSSGLALYHDLTGVNSSSSGALNTRLTNTGVSIMASISSLTGVVKTYGDQFITGVKTFFNPINFKTGSARITATGSSPNYVDLNITGIPSTGNNVELKSQDSMLFLLDSNNDGDYSRAYFTGNSNSSFIVGLQTTSPIYNNRIFMVNPSGVGLFKDTVILNAPKTVPSASTDPGISGQIAWDSNYLYVCTGGNAGWGRVALSTW